MKGRDFVETAALAGAVGAGAYTGAGTLGEALDSEDVPTTFTATETATATSTQTESPTQAPTTTETSTATSTR